MVLPRRFTYFYNRGGKWSNVRRRKRLRYTFPILDTNQIIMSIFSVFGDAAASMCIVPKCIFVLHFLEGKTQTFPDI